MSFRTLSLGMALAVSLWGCGGSVSISSGGGGAGGSTSNGGGGTTASTGGTTSTPSTGGTTTTSITTGVGGACAGVEPTLPDAPCKPSDPSCHAGTNACLAAAEFGGAPKFGMRMAQLTIQKPDSLTAQKNPIVANILQKSVTPNQPTCNLNGIGTFSWLLAFDLTTNKLKTGSASWSGPGPGMYTFGGGSVPGLGMSFSLEPATLDLSVDSGCQFQSTAGDVNLQIFLNSADEYLLLPIAAMKMSGAISGAHNCIGKYDVLALDLGAQCLPPAFEDGGALSGVIGLSAADHVPVNALKETLCALLTGQNDGDPMMKHCPVGPDGSIVPAGDACFATGGPAEPGCADALFFQATFAASGVTIN